MSNNGFISTLSMYKKKVEDFGSQTSEVYHSLGKGLVSQVEGRFGKANGVLASRVYSSALEILINLCALTGFFAFPACVVLAAKRIFPIHPVVTEAVRSRGSKEALVAKWHEVVESYKRSLTDTIAPGLMAAFAVDAVFCSVVGVITMNPVCLLRALALTGPGAYYIYKTLLRHFEEEEAKRPPAGQAEAAQQIAVVPAEQQPLNQAEVPLPPIEEPSALPLVQTAVLAS